MYFDAGVLPPIGIRRFSNVTLLWSSGVTARGRIVAIAVALRVAGTRALVVVTAGTRPTMTTAITVSGRQPICRLC